MIRLNGQPKKERSFESSIEFKKPTFKNVGFFANSGVNNSKLLSLSDAKPKVLAST